MLVLLLEAGLPPLLAVKLIGVDGGLELLVSDPDPDTDPRPSPPPLPPLPVVSIGTGTGPAHDTKGIVHMAAAPHAHAKSLRLFVQRLFMFVSLEKADPNSTIPETKGRSTRRRLPSQSMNRHRRSVQHPQRRNISSDNHMSLWKTGCPMVLRHALREQVSLVNGGVLCPEGRTRRHRSTEGASSLLGPPWWGLGRSERFAYTRNFSRIALSD